MAQTRNLLKSTPEQVQKFLSSFDVVLSDCDGVLWYLNKPIEGAMEALRKLQNLGKRIYLVSNNSSISIDQYRKKIRSMGLETKPDQIINTAKVITWYLKKINFSDEAFVIVTAAFRQTLIDAGIKLAPENPKVVEDDVVSTVKAVRDRPSVKAVIVDFSLFCDWAKLAFAISCLKRKDVLYLCGAQDEWVVCGADEKILGPGPLINIITTQSGRRPIECAKPSKILKDYVLEMCKVPDPKRCLFVGDTINYDMKFGTMCGFIKLFVGTGLDRITDAEENDEARPDYYLPSLGSLGSIIDSVSNNSTNEKNS